MPQMGAERPSSASTLTKQEAADLYTTVLQYRLARNPMPPHHNLYLFVEGNIGAVVAQRFPKYHVILASGRNKWPLRSRWYSLTMGRYAPATAYVLLDAAEGGRHIVELRKHNGKWKVTDDHEIVIT